MTLIQTIPPTMRFMKMLANCRIFVFSDTLKKVSGCIADIICIAQLDHIQNQRCVVYHFVCDLCDADYVRYTARQLFQRVAKHKNSVIGKRFHEAHGRRDCLNEGDFNSEKASRQIDCLVFEMLYIKKSHLI